MEWFESKGDVEGVERVLRSKYGKDCESNVGAIQLGRVLVGRSSEEAVSTGPLSVYGIESR